MRRPGVLLRDLSRWFDLLREVVSAPNGLAAFRAVMRYIAVTDRRLDKEELKETVRRFAALSEDRMDTLYDALVEEYMEQGIERGRREGLEDGRRAMLLRQLHRRFGDIPEPVRQRVARAGIALLDTWADNVLTAATLDGVFEGT